MTVADELHALVAAAGQGRRFGGPPKQYRRLAGATVLEHALRPLLDHAAIADVTVVLADGDRAFRELAVADESRLYTALGGAERADSVLAGLEAIAARSGPGARVLVHDAARPCLHPTELTRLIAAGTGVLAVPLGDTLKRVDDSERLEVSETLPGRERLWRAMTPQVFELSSLLAACREARARGERPTDEAAAMEAAGHSVRLVPGLSSNIKLTRAEDLELAEAILAHRLAHRLAHSLTHRGERS